MIQTIFGSPVVIFKANNIKEIFSEEKYQEMVNHLMSPSNECVGHPYTRGGKICTTDLNSSLESKMDLLDGLLNFLKQKGLEYAYLYSSSHVKDLVLHTMWVNLSFRGCEIKNHQDKYADTVEKTLIILFYPKAPVGGSNLVFIHNSDYGEWASDRQEQDLIRIRIEDGTVAIFDNFALHAVDKHTPDDPRMCIATEFKLIVN